MNSTATPIYVESHIDASIEELWAHTQEPLVHQRWDVRFTEIDYLDAPADGSPQQFIYGTQVLPGLVVDGRGETLGERHRADGTAYSGLKFWSDRRLSLIREGAGYWRYVPAADGHTRFLTRYDYRVRWGWLGTIIDRYVFRPLFGWGTAWSFDRLRLWLEEGITPEQSLKNTLAHATSVLTLAALLFVRGAIDLAATEALIGATQVALGLATLRFWRQRWPFGVALAALPLLVISDPSLEAGLFGVAVAALTSCALLTRNNLPSGRTPLRAPLGRAAN